LRQDGELVAATSRFSRRSLPWPTGPDDKQLDYLLELGRSGGLDGWTLFPTGDETAALVARHHDRLARRFRLTTPPWAVLRWAYDKRLTYRLAEEQGVDHPWTCYPSGAEELAELGDAFPVILKPAVKKDLNQFTHDKAWLVQDEQELVARYAEASALVPANTIMVQDVVPGGGEAQFSYVALCADGRPLASMVARRTRQYPSDFGHSSSYVETVEEPTVEELACRLLEAMQYTGIVEVEFKLDRRDGRYKLLDVNPRVWTWHTLCRRAGVDFPYLLWQHVNGDPVPKARGHAGVRWVRMSTDLLAAAGELRRGRLSPSAYLQSLRQPLEPATFAPDDPAPAIVAPVLLAYNLWRRALIFTRKPLKPSHEAAQKQEDSQAA
jgi:D-aspartate ligase